jgi:hypothetical protein
MGYGFVQPLLIRLHKKLDRRLVQTMLGVMLVIIMHRHRNHGLLLSELGGYLMGADRAPAGTKRISNLLANREWSASEVESYLWERADQAIDQRMGPQMCVYHLGRECD